MLVRASQLHALGGFGESFQHCGEDLDLCFRLWRGGSQIWYRHDARIVHWGGQSSKQATEWVTINAMISYAEYFRLCRGATSALAFKAMVLLIWAPLHLAKGVVKILAGHENGERLGQRVRSIRDVLLARRATWNQARPH